MHALTCFSYHAKCSKLYCAFLFMQWRFMWRLGPRPEQTEFAELNAEPVVPAAFRDTWAEVMDGWGSKMLGAIHTVSEMIARGASGKNCQ